MSLYFGNLKIPNVNYTTVIANIALETKTVTPSKNSQTITPSNGNQGFSSVTINPIPNEYIIPTNTLQISTSGEHNVTQYAKVNVTFPSYTLETRVVTPTTSQQSITPSTGYDGLGQVTINAISTQTKTVTSNGTYTPDSGKFFSSFTVNVPTGTTINSEEITINPSETEQVITPSNGHNAIVQVTVNPVSSTYVGSEIPRNSQNSLTASGATITVPAGYYATSASKSVASGTAGTPTATKGTVSNHQVSVTPTVTNTTGYITGGTKTGTAITVKASDLVSGTLDITSNGTKDVTNYASVNVNVTVGENSWIVKNSDDLHNLVEDVPNTYIEGATETAYNGWTSTGFIPVEPNSYYLIQGTSGNKYNAFYTATKTSAASSVVIPASPNSGTAFVLIKTNNNTHYIRLSGVSSEVANYKIYKAANQIPYGNKSITANGNNINVSAYDTVSVNVPSSGTTINNQNKEVTPSESTQSITADSGYTGLGTVTINAIQTETKSITPSKNAQTINPSNGKYLKSVSVAGDADLIASNIKSGIEIFGVTGTYTASGTAPKLQEKTGIIPSTSSQIITPDDGYDGLSSVQINAISPLRAASDLTVSGATVIVPAGYYSTQATKSVATMNLPTTLANSATSGYTKVITIDKATSIRYINIPAGYHSKNEYYQISAVANGIVTAPSTISGTTATVSTGTNTLTLTKTINVTPNVTTAGYITSGTAGNSSVSLTASVTTKAAATITPSTSNQTIASGTYLTGTQTIAGDADLIAGNIKSGVNIFGVTGTYSGLDTSDATASASDINSGTTAYANGQKITGTQVINRYYTGSSAPASSVGRNGDIYFQE